MNPTHTQNRNFPFITIVMPVRNEQRFIGRTLNQLLAQDYPPDRFEIIVADGMSDDRTRLIVRDFMARHPQVRLLDNPKRLSSAGRNVGFMGGKGDLFLVVDGHCFIPDARLLRNVADCFEKSGADCLGRPQPLDPPDLTPFQRAVALARASRLGHGGDSLIYGDYEGFASPVSNGAAYRREVFQRVGYVDERFDACEDVEFNYRVELAGLKAYTSPGLTVRYYPRESLGALFRQMVRYGRGRFRFMTRHRSAVTVNQLVPAGFVIGLLILATAMLLVLAESQGLGAVGGAAGGVMLSLGSLYGIYVLMVMAESVRIAATYGRQHLSWLPMIFLTVHIGLGWGLLTPKTHKNMSNTIRQQT